MRLGKLRYVPDPRTLMLANFMAPRVLPARFNFDNRRAKFPIEPWGNDHWGNCVKVGQANHVIRLERLEQRRTLKITQDHVVTAYIDECERQFGVRPDHAGGAGDDGLYVLNNFRNWRNIGWPLDFTKAPNDARVYKISAFGELEPADFEQLKAACYLLHGVHFGIWLPRGVQGNMTRWDYNPATDTGPSWKPGSWGGHLVYAKAYDGDEFEVITWGMKVKVTKSFIARYVDEAWAAVDSFNHWKRSKEINTSGIIDHLRDIGAKVTE